MGGGTEGSYTEAIRWVYEYCREPTPQKRQHAGNKTRRVLEAFSTFEYQTGMDAISEDPVLCDLKDEALKEYYRDLLYKLVLNDGSHRREPVIKSGTIETADQFSDESIDAMVRSSLCLLYELREGHVLSHMKNRKEASETLGRWRDELIDSHGSEPAAAE